MSSVLKVDAIQNTAGTSALTIDSSGAILKPVLPYGQASCNVVTAATNKLQLTTNVISGGGLTVDQTNERMVAPITGLYAIGFTHLVNNDASSTTVEMRKNGVAMGGGTAQTEANSQYGGPLNCHIIQELTANDYIEWFVIAGTTHNNTNYNNHYVYLLG